MSQSEVKIPNLSVRGLTGLILGPALFLVIIYWLDLRDLSDQGQAVLACTIWIAVWWITEPIPIPVTSLLPLVIFPLSGALDISTTASSYGNKMIFLYMGGFMIAIAMEKWNLHKRIALNIIKSVGTNASSIILGFMIATALLSMWISNTATTLMMLPIALAVTSQLTEIFRKGDREGRDESGKFGVALMLGIAYAASIGGMATLIGTPTNAIFSAVVKDYYDAEVDFSTWISFAFPVVVVLLIICWFYLTRIAFSMKRISGAAESAKTIDDELKELGRLKTEEKWIILIFGLTALSWITRSFILIRLIPGIDDTIIAISASIILFLIPSSSKKGDRLLDWMSARKLPWGILILFGGGLTIAAGFGQSGLAQWIGNELNYIKGAELFLILLLITGLVNFLTEITSNVATASILLPILASLSVAINVHPYALMVASCMAASCAFMLPVATPPNAIVFGSGYIKITDMARTGFIMNVISIIILALAVRYFLPAIWGIDIFSSISITK
ncbi:SLC13 family permease [Bacteroidota bacterium]